MNFGSKTVSVLGIATLLMSGCTHYTVEEDPTNGQKFVAEEQMNGTQPVSMQQVADMGDCRGDNQYFIKHNDTKATAVKVRATGYGAPPKAFYPDAQRRLMSMRAAKVDAYRSLAERISGVQIWGGTTLGDMVVEKDRFRVYIDTYLRGARVIAENPQEDGSFETVVEVKVDQNFLDFALPAKSSNPCDKHAPQQKATSDKNFKKASNSSNSDITPSYYYAAE